MWTFHQSFSKYFNGKLHNLLPEVLSRWKCNWIFFMVEEVKTIGNDCKRIFLNWVWWWMCSLAAIKFFSWEFLELLIKFIIFHLPKWFFLWPNFFAQNFSYFRHEKVALLHCFKFSSIWNHSTSLIFLVKYKTSLCHFSTSFIQLRL